MDGKKESRKWKELSERERSSGGPRNMEKKPDETSEIDQYFKIWFSPVFFPSYSSSFVSINKTFSLCLLSLVCSNSFLPSFIILGVSEKKFHFVKALPTSGKTKEGRKKERQSHANVRVEHFFSHLFRVCSARARKEKKKSSQTRV